MAFCAGPEGWLWGNSLSPCVDYSVTLVVCVTAFFPLLSTLLATWRLRKRRGAPHTRTDQAHLQAFDELAVRNAASPEGHPLLSPENDGGVAPGRTNIGATVGRLQAALHPQECFRRLSDDRFRLEGVWSRQLRVSAVLLGPTPFGSRQDGHANIARSLDPPCSCRETRLLGLRCHAVVSGQYPYSRPPDGPWRQPTNGGSKVTRLLAAPVRHLTSARGRMIVPGVLMGLERG